MYLSIGLLCLSVSALIGFHLGHRTANATNLSEPVGVVLAVPSDYALTVNGEIWSYASGAWYKSSDLPIPVGQIHAMTNEDGNVHLLDKNGDYWEQRGPSWENCGQPPVSPVPTDNSSWGQIKDQHDNG
jgi:hypothetical protein